MNMKNRETKISSAVRELVNPVAQSMGYSLWDVEFVKEGADKYLRITIDSENGITIDDCERFHRAIDALLDEADPISDPYILEVSSPGVERELKYDWHIASCVGCDVEIRLYAPENGAKKFRGRLEGLSDDDRVVITDPEGNEIGFEKDKIAKISTCFDFGAG